MLVQGMILDDGNIADKSCMIVVTDACLPLVASGETPLLPRILINSDLPTKKETYLRLVSTCLAADMMVGCEVVVLKELDECSGLSFAEMPINKAALLNFKFQKGIDSSRFMLLFLLPWLIFPLKSMHVWRIKWRAREVPCTLKMPMSGLAGK
ncbi:uncharacterized protein [Elaeis guineensis]|uniref:uncharacterized protein isoform X1 n=1 Tax=Elaeis guineensis var. tenera TaxID=51953 RepID=UPI003C6D981B